ncbi:MAG: tyrosine-type recombinase/integrase [Polyangiales bacterium]
MTVRKLARSWQYDFTLEGHGRQRKAGFKTKAEACEAEKQKREDLISGRKRVSLADAYDMYMTATTMKDRSRDSYQSYWPQIEAVLGHLFIEEVDTHAIDVLKASLPTHLGPKSINHRLSLVRTVLRFMWKRGRLASVPYVPTQSVPEHSPDWYTEAERDRLLDGIFEMYPEWYLFFYLTTRLGLRRGEVYAISRDRIRDIPPQLVIDRAVQEGRNDRSAKLITRKNDRALVLALPADVMDAIRWHIRESYAGPEFLFSIDGRFSQKVNDHAAPLLEVQKALGLRELGHHKIGRHSVASQAATGGHSIKTIQAQLGHRSAQSTHRYAHLGNQAQLRLVQDLGPTSPPHVNVRSTRGRHLDD